MRTAAVVEGIGIGGSLHVERLRNEVGKSIDACDDGFEGRGNARRGGIGEMRLPVDGVSMDLRLERAADGARGSAEGDPVPAASDIMNPEALALKPGAHLGYIGVGGAEALAELPGRKPLVIVGRSGVLLFGEKRFEPVGGLEKQSGVSDGEGVVYRPVIYGRLQGRMHVTDQSHSAGWIDLGD